MYPQVHLPSHESVTVEAVVFSVFDSVLVAETTALSLHAASNIMDIDRIMNSIEVFMFFSQSFWLHNPRALIHFNPAIDS